MKKYLTILTLIGLPLLAHAAATVDKTSLVGEWAVEGYEGYTYQFEDDGTLTINNRCQQTTASWDAVTLRGQGYVVMCTPDGGYFFAAAELNGNRLTIREVCQGTGGKIYMNRQETKVISLVKTE